MRENIRYDKIDGKLMAVFQRYVNKKIYLNLVPPQVFY